MKILQIVRRLSSNSIIPALLVAAAFTISGCESSFDTRASERTAVYDKLNPEVRARLRKGHIRVGDTTDMVYISWGAPLKVENRPGASAVWLYVLEVPDPNAVGTLITSPDIPSFDVGKHVNPSSAMIIGGQEGTKKVTARVVFNGETLASIE